MKQQIFKSQVPILNEVTFEGKSPIHVNYVRLKHKILLFTSFWRQSEVNLVSLDIHKKFVDDVSVQSINLK